jgi:hypothetical protein
VHHHLSLEDHEWVQERSDPSGESTSEVYTSEQGTVVVHLVDAKSGETVWLSWGQADIEVALRSPENMRRWVYELTAKIFQRWPMLERASAPD